MFAHPEVTTAILAGGRGTRLRSAVADRPKVLAQVQGRPFVTYIFDQLARASIREVVLLTGYAADQVRDTLGDHHAGMRLRYSQEPTPLGTGGAVRWALPRVTTRTVLLLNGDSYCDVDLVAFWEAHRRRGLAASMVVANVADTARFGTVRLGIDARVLCFEEKQSDGGPGGINAGIYLLERRLLEELPSGRAMSLERDLLPVWVASGQVHGFACSGRFLDIGTPESYGQAETFFESAAVMVSSEAP